MLSAADALQGGLSLSAGPVARAAWLDLGDEGTRLLLVGPRRRKRRACVRLDRRRLQFHGVQTKLADVLEEGVGIERPHHGKAVRRDDSD